MNRARNAYAFRAFVGFSPPFVRFIFNQTGEDDVVVVRPVVGDVTHHPHNSVRINTPYFFVRRKVVSQYSARALNLVGQGPPGRLHDHMVTWLYPLITRQNIARRLGIGLF